MLIRKKQSFLGSRRSKTSLKIKGKVARGAGRGATFGFPTANIPVKTRLNGVYAVRVKIDVSYDGVANIGYAPTFGRRQKQLEVHIFGFSQNITGKTIEVTLVKKLREEKKFSSVEDLVKQIKEDVKRAKAILEPL